MPYGNYAWAAWRQCSKTAGVRLNRQMVRLDLLSCLVSDKLTRRADRLLERQCKQAKFRDPLKTLDNFEFTFNKKIKRLVFGLATGSFITRREDALFLGPPGTGKSDLAWAIGQPSSSKAIA